MESDSLFIARRVGTTGHEIINPEGVVVAWTVDEPWATIIVAVLNPAITGSGGEIQDCTANGGIVDNEATARQAIEYLADHSPVVTVRFPADDSPSLQVMGVIEPYLHDTAAEIGELLAGYAMNTLADDFLGLGGIDIPSEGLPPTRT